MTQAEIDKVIKYLESRKDKNKMAEILIEKLTADTPIGNKEFLINKSINPAVLRKIMFDKKGE